MAARVRYHFLYRSRDRYYWESVLPITPGESRHESVSCNVNWFWESHRFDMHGKRIDTYKREESKAQ